MEGSTAEAFSAQMSLETVEEDTAWRLAIAYIDEWNARDRQAWLELLHPDLEFRPTALVGTGVVYRGLEGASSYFDELIASGRAEVAEISGLRRIAPDRFLIELDLLVEGTSVADAAIITQVREGKFAYTAGYLSDAERLVSTGLIPEDSPSLEGWRPH